MFRIDFNKDEIDAASAWHGGSGSMLYAVSSCGYLALGTIRPRNDDGEPMTDAQWFHMLACDLALEAEWCATHAKTDAFQAESEHDRACLLADHEQLLSIKQKAERAVDAYGYHGDE